MQENTQPLSKILVLGLNTFNAVGRVLRSSGVRIGEIDEDSIIRQAMKKSGIHTIIDDSFREPLKILARSANQQSNLLPAGRLVLRKFIIHRLANRLQIDALLHTHPDIFKQPVDRPIFIAALPRTGTTLLHRLFAQDSVLRTPLYWEMKFPCLPPDPETNFKDPLIRRLKLELAILDKVAPQLKNIHELGADLPEECLFLFANDLVSDFFVIAFDFPAYRQWLCEQTLHPLYVRHKQQLQLLQYRHHRERWVLKAPSHLRALQALISVYPDAYIIQIHRDPTEIIASTASLIMASWSTSHNMVNPERVGQIALDLVGSWLDKSLAGRKQAESNPDSRVQFIDIIYKDFIANPIDTIRRIYERCDLTWSPLVEQQIRTFLEKNRQHKYGKHRYSLEQFGLEKEIVYERCAEYRDSFKNIFKKLNIKSNS